MNIRILFFSLSLAIFFYTSSIAQDRSESLLTEKDLSNFQQLNGSATFHIEGDELVGTSKLQTRNSFLATKKSYGNFILEFEVLIENGLNSGVQFRSLSKEDYYKGAVHGYQCEIETSPRKWAGGIYDESRRGWLADLEENEAGQKAFDRLGWNRYRILARKDSIFTWINEVPAVALKDTVTASGFIAFQVHATDKTEPMEVRWRNIRVREITE